jgi:RNA 2',3'-cyclic 3'-phosphodiesterase
MIAQRGLFAREGVIIILTPMRLFISVTLSSPTQEKLVEAAHSLERTKCDLRVVCHPHLTMKFLGAVSADKCTAVKARLAAVGAECAPFHFTVEGAGAFPKRGAVRIVWAGISRGRAEFERLMTLCDTAFAELGFEVEEREKTPHITLARIRRDNSALRPAIEAWRIGPWEEYASTLTLFESITAADGARYTEIETAPLLGHF